MPSTIAHEANNVRLDDLHVSYGSLRLSCELWNRGRGGGALEEVLKLGTCFFLFETTHVLIFGMFPWPRLLRYSINLKGSPDISREQCHRRGYPPTSRGPREKNESRLEARKTNRYHLPGVHSDFEPRNKPRIIYLTYYYGRP